MRAWARHSDGRALELTGARLWLEDSAGSRHSLGRVAPVAGGKVLQTNLVVPQASPGPARLEWSIEGERGQQDFGARSVPVEITRAEPEAVAVLWASATTSAREEPHERQPEGHTIDLRPGGRLLAGFDSTLWLRVGDAQAQPEPMHYEMSLISGEFAGQRAERGRAVVLQSGKTDGMGLALLEGRLDSEAVRMRVRICAEACAESGDVAERSFFFASRPGGVQLYADPQQLSGPLGRKLALRSQSLSARRPVFVDLHAPGGRWAATTAQPVPPGDARFQLDLPNVGPQGVWQLEASHAGRAEDAATALWRTYVPPAQASPGDVARNLLTLQRSDIEEMQLEARRESDERTRLAGLEATIEGLEARAEGGRESWPRLHRYLLETLAVRIYGSPTPHDTLAPAREALAQKKQRWTRGLRAFMAIGGTLYILAFAWVVWANYRQLERAMTHALGDGHSGEADTILIGRRALALRGVLAVAFVAATVVLIVAMMESFVWQH